MSKPLAHARRIAGAALILTLAGFGGHLLYSVSAGDGDHDTAAPAAADRRPLPAHGAAPRLVPFNGDLPTRLMPPVSARVDRYLAQHEPSEPVARRLRELARMAAELDANPIRRDATPEERARYVAAHDTYRRELRATLEDMTATERMALFRARINPLQLARAVARR